MQEITVPQAIEITVNLLGNIAVPRNLNDSIGVPIDSAIGNLKQCMAALKPQEQPLMSTGDEIDVTTGDAPNET